MPSRDGAGWAGRSEHAGDAAEMMAHDRQLDDAQEKSRAPPRMLTHDPHATHRTVPRETHTPLLAYWLIPAEPHKSRLIELIHALAKKLETPVFDPHVTLYATHSRELDWAYVEHAIRDFGPITLRVVRIAFSDQFTKTLFIEFAGSGILNSLCASLRILTPNPSDYVLQPHLSLLYKTMSDSQKRVLAESTVVPFSEIPFDKIQVITGNATVTNPRDVQSWRVLHSRRLFV
jgi:hypothetical protein